MEYEVKLEISFLESVRGNNVESQHFHNLIALNDQDVIPINTAINKKKKGRKVIDT